MDKELTNIKDRVLKLTEYKGISKELFFKKIGMTYGNFKGKNKESTLNSDAIESILTNIPDINLEWLLTGKGEMLKPKEGIDYSDEAIQFQNEEINKLLREISELKDRIIRLQDERFKNKNSPQRDYRTL